MKKKKNIVYTVRSVSLLVQKKGNYRSGSAAETLASKVTHDSNMAVAPHKVFLFVF